MNIDINALSKTDAGRKQILAQFSQVTTGIDRRNDSLCWDMYNNEHKESEYDYLRKYGDYELPAHVVHIPKQRPYIDYLTSRQIDRPYVFSVTAVDKKSLERKHENRIKKQIEIYIATYKQRHTIISAQIQKLNQQAQMLSQQVQSGDPNDPEQAQAMQQAQMILPQILQAIDNAKTELTDVQILNDKGMEKMKKFQDASDREIMEIWAQVACRSLRKSLNIKQKSTQNFINACVSGKEAYYVDYRPGDKTIVFRSLTPHMVFYQSIDDIQWIQDLDWVGFEEYMSPTDVMSEFGSRMSDDEQKTITSGNFTLSNFNTGKGTFIAGPGNKVYDSGKNVSGYVSSGSLRGNDGVSVKRVWWLAEATPTAIKKPNPYRKGKYFTNIIPPDDTKPIIDESEYKYNTHERKYIHREKEGIQYEGKNVRVFNSNKNEYVDRRIRYDRYKGVIINNQIFISEKDIQVRDVDNLSKNYLPIVGPTFNNITYQPYSLIWATKDLQKSYNIVFYHRALMMAVAGAKSFLMDNVQKPTGMSDQEWEYKKKLGTIEIETRKKGVGSVPATFNQFQVIDMSLSASIQYFDAILESIDNQIGLIMGVTRPAMGQVQNTDQVGTFQLSQRSTLLITQVLYDKHDEIERQALLQMLRLAKNFLLDEDTIMQTINPDGTEDLVRIPAGALKNADFDFIVQSNSKEENSRIELMQFAMNNYKAGMLPFHNFVSMYNTESLKELELMSIYFAEESQRLAMESRQAEGEQIAAVEDKKSQLAIQMAEFSEKMKQDTEKMKIQWEQSKKESDDAFKQKELELKAKELEQKALELEQTKYLELFKLSNTKESEDNVIMENQRATNIDAQIRMFEIQLQEIQAHLKKDTDEKKINVEHEKARKMVKEHVSNL